MDTSFDTAAVVLPCREIDPTATFFIDELGFRLDVIFPADDPSVAMLSGHGLTLRLERGSDAPPATLRLERHAAGTALAGEPPLVAPNGTRIILADTDTGDPPAPRQSLVVQRLEAGAWGTGRAGMRYRDLVPGRQGGRFIASHIRIPDGGPVPDYVHYHKIHFQMIYCHKGWVKVVYEDQGPPFVMRPGDCVLQPPEIRHRVLEASDGLEVIEIGCPAEHPTHVDHELVLPTPDVRPERRFGGQRFVHHQAEKAEWKPAPVVGFEARDLGIGTATGGLAEVRVLRPHGAARRADLRHDGDFRFSFVLEGNVTLEFEDGAVHALSSGDSITIPAGLGCAITDRDAALNLLDVSLPA